MVPKSVIRNISVVTTAAFVFSGCPSMPEWTKDETVQGGVLGVAACGGAAALLGGKKEIIVGAAALCGTLAAIGGDMLKKRRKQYASDEAFYNEEIDNAQQFNAEKMRYKTQLVAEIDQLRTETEKLVSLQKQGRASQQALTTQKIALKKKQEEVKEVVKEMTDELAFQNALYAEIEKQDPTDSRLANLETEVKTLQQAIAEVEKQQSQLADLDDNLT